MDKEEKEKNMGDDDKKKWKINLLMADATFPVWIDPENEEMVRKAAKLVNQRLNMRRQEWSSKVSKENILAIVAYDFALETLRYQERNDTQPYAIKIEELTDLLKRFIQEQK